MLEEAAEVTAVLWWLTISVSGILTGEFHLLTMTTPLTMGPVCWIMCEEVTWNIWIISPVPPILGTPSQSIIIVNRPRHPLYMESLYNKRNPCHDVIVNLVIKVPKLGNNPEPVAWVSHRNVTDLVSASHPASPLLTILWGCLQNDSLLETGTMLQ